MNELKISVLHKVIYSKDMYYPACEKSKLFAEIAGSKTLTVQNLNKVKQLGYTVEVTTKQHEF